MTKEQTDNILKQIKITHQSKAMHRAPIHTTIDWLIKRIDELEIRLELSEANVNDYALLVTQLRAKLRVATEIVEEEDVKDLYVKR